MSLLHKLAAVTPFDDDGMPRFTNLWSHPLGLSLTREKWVELKETAGSYMYTEADDLTNAEFDCANLASSSRGTFGAFKCTNIGNWQNLVNHFDNPWKGIIAATVCDHMITADRLCWYEPRTGELRAVSGLHFIMAMVMVGYDVPKYARYWYEVLPGDLWEPIKVVNSTGLNNIRHTATINDAWVFDSYDHAAWVRESMRPCGDFDSDEASWFNLDEEDGLFEDMAPTVSVKVTTTNDFRSFPVEANLRRAIEIKVVNPSSKKEESQINFRYKLEAGFLPIATSTIKVFEEERHAIYTDMTKKMPGKFVAESNENADWPWIGPPRTITLGVRRKPTGVFSPCTIQIHGEVDAISVPVLPWRTRVFLQSKCGWRMDIQVLPTRTSAIWCPTGLELYRSCVEQYAAFFTGEEWEIYQYMKYRGVLSTLELQKFASAATILVRASDLENLPSVPMARQYGSPGIAVGDFALCPHTQVPGFTLGGMSAGTSGYFGPTMVPLNKTIHSMDLMCAMAEYPREIWAMVSSNVSGTLVFGRPMVSVMHSEDATFYERIELKPVQLPKAFVGPSPIIPTYRDRFVFFDKEGHDLAGWKRKNELVEFSSVPRSYRNYIISSPRRFYLAFMYQVCLYELFQHKVATIGVEAEAAWKREVLSQAMIKEMLMYVHLSINNHGFLVDFISAEDWHMWRNKWKVNANDMFSLCDDEFGDADEDDEYDAVY